MSPVHQNISFSNILKKYFPVTIENNKNPPVLIVIPLGAPAEPTNIHFKKPLVIETYHDDSLEIKLSENGRIILEASQNANSGIEVSAEDALGIMRGTGTKVDKLNENEQIIYNQLLNRAKEKSEHSISEVAETVSDRRQENINKTVSEISDAMRETEKENIKTKED